jgi:predicted nucleic acid-binding protein
LLRDEAAAARVENVIAGGDALVSWINLGEVFYIEARRVGEDAAADAVAAVAATLTAEVPDEQLVLSAARLKARHELSYADAFAVATAERHRATLLSGDPEIVRLSPAVDIEDLRA